MKYESTEGMKIFEPFSIKSMHLKNRLGIGPYGSHPAGEDGSPNETTVRYYETLAESNIGFIMVGNSDPVPRNSGMEKYSSRVKLRISDDQDTEGWSKVVAAIHKHDVSCGIQLGLFGMINNNFFSEMEPDLKKYAFSQMGTAKTLTEMPEGYIISKEDIKRFIKFCGQAARRAKEAGFDCVSVHNAHSDIMLGACSLDPMFNNRDDEYGGDIEGRLRFTVELIQEIRRNVGDLPITMRINGDDVKGELGNSLEDICKYIVPELEKAGLDAIDVSQGGAMYAGHGNLPTLYYPRACWMHVSSAIKKHATVPVFGVGRVTSLEMAEKILREGLVDILYFGRQSYVDNQVLNKFREGKCMPSDVRQCLGCDTVCFPCAMNYEAPGMRGEEILPLAAAEKPKDVLIIGGGVGGMESARIAAARGHKVTLWEKASKLGGAVGVLATTPHLAEFQNAVDYLSGQMADLNVDVRVCQEATVEKIKERAPDVVILATGTSEKLPEIFEGQPMVMSLMEAITRKREFKSFADWHKKIWFSGFTGAEFALDLADEGAEVTMVGPGGDSSVAAEQWFTRDRKVYLRKRLTDGNFVRRGKDTQRANVKMLFRSKIESVDAEGVHYYHNGIHKVDEYDAVIITSPRQKNDQMFEKLKECVPEVYMIGDCDKTGMIRDAIRTANEVARVI